MVVVRYETPAAGEEGLDFEALLLAALRTACAIGIEQAAVINAKVGVLDRSIFKRFGAQCSTFQNAAPAHKLGPQRSVHPLNRSQVKGVTEDESLARALPDIGNQKPGFSDLLARRR